jgi:UDP-glucose 4-epimerase
VRALVTGAAGFIGSTLVDKLLAEGHLVIGVDNLSSGSPGNLEGALGCDTTVSRRFSLIVLDIQAPELVDVVGGCNPDVVFHLAAQVDPWASMRDPQFDARSNVVGTINVCEATRLAGVRRLVYASCSNSVCSDAYGRIHDNPSAMVRLTPHTAAKAAGDLYLRAYASAYALQTISLSLPTVYGPRQSSLGGAGLIASLGGAITPGGPPDAHANQCDNWDFVYVDDVVDAFVRAAGLPVGDTGTYTITSGRRTSLAELGSLVAIASRDVVPRCSSPDDKHLSAPSEIPSGTDELVWCPTVDLTTGLERTLCWLRAGIAVSERATA